MPLDVLPQSTSTGGLTDAELRASDVPVSVSSLPLPTGAATETTVATLLREGANITGASMPSGGSYAMGWLSAIWKGITDRLPSALVGGRLDVNVGNTPAVTFSGDVTTVGKAAHDAAVSGNPILLGAFGSTATPAAVSADGDVVRLWADRSGSMHVIVDSGSVTVAGSVSVTSLPGVSGPTAHDNPVTFSPVLIAGSASAAAPSAVSADGDVVRMWMDRYGRVHNNNHLYDFGNSVWIPKSTHYRGTAFASSLRVSGNYDSSVLDSYGHKYLIIYATLEVTASGTLTIAVNDSTGAYRLATAGTAISTTTPVVYAMGDGLTVPATGLTYYGQVWAIPVPGQFKIRGTTTTNSTWKVEYELVG